MEKPLSEKYRKALQLIEDGKLSFRQIAKECGIAERTMYDLIEGKIEKHGNYGKQFYQLLQEAGKRKDKQIKELVKNNKVLSQSLINEFLASVSQSKTQTQKHKAIYQVTRIVNALSKSTPNVEIGSFTYQKGLSAEDIYAEFKRLSGITSERRAVSGAPAGGTGEIPLASGSRGAVTQEPEDTVL